MFEEDGMLQHYDPIKYVSIPHDYKDKLSGNVIFLDTIDSVFHKSIELIKKQSSVGVTFEGNNVSRYGEVNLICISTATSNFIFDVNYFGKEAFINGLKDIFESDVIEKIIHDCRQAADALLHVYETELVNIFDTQVADYIVRAKNGTEPSADVWLLDQCISHYLNVPNEFLCSRINFAQSDIIAAYLALRPLDEDLKDYCIKNVIYLRHLRQALSHRMYGPFRTAVQCYLNALAPLPDAEVVLRTVDDDVPPSEFIVMFESFILGSE